MWQSLSQQICTTSKHVSCSQLLSWDCYQVLIEKQNYEYFHKLTYLVCEIFCTFSWEKWIGQIWKISKLKWSSVQDVVDHCIGSVGFFRTGLKWAGRILEFSVTRTKWLFWIRRVFTWRRVRFGWKIVHATFITSMIENWRIVTVTSNFSEQAVFKITNRGAWLAMIVTHCNVNVDLFYWCCFNFILKSISTRETKTTATNEWQLKLE